MKKRQQGMALLVVLLIISLMTIIAVSVNERWQRSYQRSSALHYLRKAKWYAFSGEALVKEILLQDYLDSEENINLSQTWATEGRVYPLEDAHLEMVVFDEQACFNINAINQNITSESNENNQNSYIEQVLLHLLINIDVEEYEAKQIVAAIQDWIDEDDTPSELGAEDNYYLSIDPPYLTANRPLKNISELRAIRGITAEIYQKLRPYVCALPEKKLSVNINTIRKFQAPFLQALLLNQVSEMDVIELINSRPRKGWQSVSDFIELDEIKVLDTILSELSSGGVIDVRSHYFRLITRITIDDFHYMVTSLLKIKNETIDVIERQYGLGKFNTDDS